MKRWSVDRVAGMLDFSCGNRFGATSAMIRMQTEGVAAVCEILRKRHVAYLADEVGLGKTMQALGVAACLSQGRTQPRVLVMSPRKLVQNAWQAEHARFTNYVVKDPALALKPAFHDSLRDWLSLGPGTAGVHLLRHSSFTRPVYNSKGSWLQAVSALKVPDGLRRVLEQEQPRETGDNGFDYNLAFARGVNKWLRAQDISFDLMVVDEAQCLRNLKHQQTNSVFQALFQGLGENWLFMSATPAHSGVYNIATVLNEYAGQGPIIGKDCLQDLDSMKATLKRYMIRRPREFLIADTPVHKSHYREDDDQTLKLHCQDPLSALSIALVQKHLAAAMGREGGRFRSGFIASFESLDDSLRGRRFAAPALLVDADTDDALPEVGDFYMEHHYSVDDPSAPDEEFVSRISRDFLSRFGMGLPHPKLDGVEEDLVLKAYGDPEAGDPGGTKSVVFCRRLSSVKVLRERLIRRYLTSVQARCVRVWGVQLDWDRMMKGEGPDATGSEEGPRGTAEEHVEWDDVNRVRQAHTEGKWLYKFRMTFSDGRNALVLELNWFERLCRETGVSIQDAAACVPSDLWSQSQALATRSGRRYRAEQARWLVWLVLDRCAGSVFGFDEAQAAHWKTVLKPIFGIPDEVSLTVMPQSVAPEMEILLFRSIWTLVEEASDTAMHLPGAQPGCIPSALYWRKIVATVIGQYMRLTDTAIDLYFADKFKEKDSLPRKFTDWLLGPDSDAVRLRHIWKDWVQHHVLIFSSAVGEQANVTPAGLAASDSFEFLRDLDPVVGITGSAGGHKRALQQFNTPGMPFVMVGTDTIREGVNLHLFCDRVMHYGMPWTPGDMEQRIGRVDRYFGRIERRLHSQANGGAPAKLQILYPHLRDTVELQQIRTVMHRRRESEAVTEDTLGIDRKELDSKFIELDAVLAPAVRERTVSAPREGLFGVARHLKP